MDVNNFGMVDRADEDRSREITQEYLNYLDDSATEKINTERIEQLIKDGGNRLVLNMSDIRAKMPDRANGLQKHFVQEILCLEQATKDMIARLDSEYGKDKNIQVGFEGTFGDRHVNPRSLKSGFLGNLVCCEGIVTR
ncbi:DNA replication licensing factor MCM3, partial [Aphelenchoides avenae]